MVYDTLSINKFLEKCEFLGSQFRDKYETEIKHDPQNYKVKQLNEFNKPFKTKVACLMLYPDCPEHLAAIKYIVELGGSIQLQYAMIIHDLDKLDTDFDLCDEDKKIENFSLDGIHKKPHVHCVIKFNSQRYNTGVAKMLGISSYYVKMFADKLFSDRIAYLAHCDNYDKFQYPAFNIIGTLADKVDDIINSYLLQPFDMFLNVCDHISSLPKDRYITRSYLQDYLIRIGYSTILKGTFYRLLCERVGDHNEHISHYVHDKKGN